MILPKAGRLKTAVDVPVTVTGVDGVQIVFVYCRRTSLPTTNILAPSLENAMPVGLPSSDETGKASTKTAVVTLKAVASVYSFTSFPELITYYEHLGAVT